MAALHGIKNTYEPGQGLSLDIFTKILDFPTPLDILIWKKISTSLTMHTTKCAFEDIVLFQTIIWSTALQGNHAPCPPPSPYDGIIFTNKRTHTVMLSLYSWSNISLNWVLSSLPPPFLDIPTLISPPTFVVCKKNRKV